jgi:hypothetical protein
MHKYIDAVKRIKSTYYRIMSIILLIVVQILVIVFGIRVASSLDKTMIMYLSSTCAQVIAALFGLVVTGYVFFNDRLGELIDQDDTVTSAVEALRKTYYTFLCGLSISCVLAIILNIVNILSNKENEVYTGWFNLLIISESVFFTVLSVVLIVIFVWKVINPNRIKDISTKELNRMNNEIKGDISEKYLPEFLKAYNEIERIIDNLAEGYIAEGHKPNQMYQNLKMLLSSEKISQSLANDINILRQYRNFLVHGNEMLVSHEKCSLALNVLNKLKNTPI